MPYQLGKVTDALAASEMTTGISAIPWKQITIYLGLRYVQGHGSALGFIERQLWTRISQAATRSLALSGFRHVLDLGVDYHISHGASDIISTLERNHAILGFVEKVTFQMIPLAIDIVLAVGYFVLAFDRYYATVVVCVATSYVWASTRLSRVRAEQKRKFYASYSQEYRIKHDAITAYDTVKYFNAGEYEQERYLNAINEVQSINLRYQASNHILSLIQNTIFTVILLVSCVFSAYKVSMKESKVGSFVTLLTYMKQLQHPLDQLTNFLKSTQDNLVSAEKIIEMLETKPSITECPNAKSLRVPVKGEITFSNVSFSYPTTNDKGTNNQNDKANNGEKKEERQIQAISDFTFNCPSGSTVAFVGESGGGKSTLFRLLFRFYDPTSGTISIDGQDIRDLTLSSLADNIGVVPQECALFNDTIMYNLRYARRDATDDEIFSAAKAASIHDKIMRFPEGYNTVVGERGLRLSGGEKQRIAIARAILKNPPILLLDEATAMLDIESERHIQHAIRELSRERTTLVIAHRLSTIISADLIVVIHDGRVVEMGSHRHLIGTKGKYYSMWKKQVAPMFADYVTKGETEEEFFEKILERKVSVKQVNIDTAKEKPNGKRSAFFNDLDI